MAVAWVVVDKQTTLARAWKLPNSAKQHRLNLAAFLPINGTGGPVAAWNGGAREASSRSLYEQEQLQSRSEGAPAQSLSTIYVPPIAHLHTI